MRSGRSLSRGHGGGSGVTIVHKSISRQFIWAHQAPAVAASSWTEDGPPEQRSELTQLIVVDVCLACLKKNAVNILLNKNKEIKVEGKT